MSLAAPLTAHEEALAFLFGRIDYERGATLPYGARDFKLDRMRELIRRLGHPEAALPIVHVAGTKGKGSTSAMIAAALTAAGYRTGLFSSPHLENVEERLRIDARCCSAEELVELVRGIRPVAEAMDADPHSESAPPGPTYFELNTAMALLHFAAQRVDAAVLEVGLGGRLDSTNVCTPRVAVITSISFDHTKQLGDTLASIAWEKAGIVKPGIPTISGVVPDEPRRVIQQVCQERQSRLIEAERDFAFTYHPPRRLDLADARGRIDFRYLVAGSEVELLGMELGLVGRHQAANAAVALASRMELRRQGWEIPEAAIRCGLAEVSWPARVEVVSRRPTVVIDAAHNVASVEALLESLEESFAARRRVLIFATTKDKDIPGMLLRLLPRFETIVFTRYTNNPRSVPPADLARLAAELSGREFLTAADPAAAWELVQSLVEPADLICISGSFFLAGQMRAQIAPQTIEKESKPS
jgi:dihydrofolate synthase/folylpolyglutamate synthase